MVVVCQIVSMVVVYQIPFKKMIHLKTHFFIDKAYISKKCSSPKLFIVLVLSTNKEKGRKLD